MAEPLPLQAIRRGTVLDLGKISATSHPYSRVHLSSGVIQCRSLFSISTSVSSLFACQSYPAATLSRTLLT